MQIKEGKHALYIGEAEETAGTYITFVQRDEGVIAVEHTVVEEAFRGQGIALELVRAVTRFARERGLKIIPVCPYAEKVLLRDKVYADVLFLK